MIAQSHSLDRDFVAERLAARRNQLAKIIEYAHEDPDELGRLMLTGRAVAGYQAATDPSCLELPRVIRMVAQAAAALFGLASLEPGTSVGVALGDAPVVLAATGATSSAHAGRWLDGFFCALIARDQASIARLCATPIDVLKASSTRGDTYGELLVDALQSVGRGNSDADSAARLLKALHATAPEQIAIEPVDRVLHIVVPQIELLYHVLNNDAAGFNNGLEKALRLHRKYWTTIADEGINDPDALLALGPTAMACLAHDRGFAVDIESHYVPRQLIHG